MSPEVWKQIEELYLAARDGTAEQRAALPGRAAPEVRDRVNAMLMQDGSALDHPAWHGRDWLLSTETGTLPAMQLGPYKVEECIGEGGMGQVYRSVDTRLGRAVAIKLLSPELAAERELSSTTSRTMRASISSSWSTSPAEDRLAAAVSGVFLPRQKQADRAAPPTRHAGAYELYLRAVHRQVHVDKFEMASAIDMLARATELDPHLRPLHDYPGFRKRISQCGASSR